jgi:hypothetical protein
MFFLFGFSEAGIYILGMAVLAMIEALHHQTNSFNCRL